MALVYFSIEKFDHTGHGFLQRFSLREAYHPAMRTPLWMRGVLLAGTLAATASGQIFTQLQLPDNTQLTALAAGPDGNVWVGEIPYAAANARIARITPFGAVTHFELPGRDSYPVGIVAGPDGNVWFTEGNSVARISPTTGTITEFALPNAKSYPSGIAAGPDGKLWFTESAGRIGRITTEGSLTEFELPAKSSPLEITTGADGNLWFTNARRPIIGRITSAGVITEFAVNTPASEEATMSIAAGPDGNLWFTETEGVVGRITTSGTVTEFPVPYEVPFGSYMSGITAGPDGNLWFPVVYQGVCCPSGFHICRMTPAGRVDEFTPPTLPYYGYNNSIYGNVAIGPDHNLWFTAESLYLYRLALPFTPPRLRAVRR